MQSSPDRDQFVKIHTDNITEGKGKNFKKYNVSFVTQFNISYDLGSIMHYGEYTFSKYPEAYPTIEALVS